jgi:hypothetical protein
MTRKRLWVAAVVVIVSNLYALGSAGVNRRGQPDAVLELTERELRLAPRKAENTAMTLRLAWTDPAPGEQEPGWFDAAKLTSIGFDCRVPVTAENAAHYRAMPPRSTYAALEYGGHAWQRCLDALPAADRELGGRRPRLVLIDVSNDDDALRARYPDRRQTVIVSATARLAFVQSGTRPPFLNGRVTLVYPEELSVPRELRTAIESMPARSSVAFDPRYGRSGQALADEPRYRVTVKWGRSLEPWIESVHAIDGTR